MCQLPNNNKRTLIIIREGSNGKKTGYHDLVNTKKSVYKNNRQRLPVNSINSLYSCLLSYSKKKVEEFFKDERLYFFFLAFLRTRNTKRKVLNLVITKEKMMTIRLEIFKSSWVISGPLLIWFDLMVKNKPLPPVKSKKQRSIKMTKNFSYYIKLLHPFLVDIKVMKYFFEPAYS
jgi:hypothetical protein